MHALEWIEKNGTFMRSISLTLLRENLGREKGHCTWCDGQLKNGLRRWCSAECRVEGYIRGGEWDHLVWNRDRGICSICEKDTETHTINEKNMYRVPYDIDHIIPVVEGGGLCGLDNLRTLCIPCHKKETKILAGRVAKKRRPRDESKQKCRQQTIDFLEKELNEL